MRNQNCDFIIGQRPSFFRKNSPHMKKKENPTLSLLFNIVLPVLILNKAHTLFGHDSGVLILLLALSLPTIYGIFDFIRKRKKNILSAFGILNILMTGGLAILKVEGIWFAIKEASFPALIGIFIFISAYAKKPAFQYLLSHSHIFNWSLIESKIKTSLELTQIFQSLLKRSTIWLSYSFFISAMMNFVLALHIFSDSSQISPNKETLLNQNIADMTWLGFLVIGVPMTIFSIIIFLWFMKRLSTLVQLPMESLLKKH